MTTYNSGAVTNAVIAYQKPITLQQGRALRDNPISIAEADASAPASLLPTVHLGTLTTTSGTSQTLSSLVLAPYKFLRMMLKGVSFTAAVNLRLDGQTIVLANLGAAGNLIYGHIVLELASGLAIHSYYETTSAANGNMYALTGYTNASTSITFDGGTFDAGSIRVYGEK